MGAGGSDLCAAQPQGAGLAAGHYPGLSYAMLAVLLLVSGARSLMFSLAPADRLTFVYEVGATLFFVVLAIVLWFLGPRTPRDWGLDAGIAAAGFVLVGSVTVAGSPQAQVLVGLALALYAVCAACFLPWLRVLLVVGALLFAYAVALAINRMLDPVYVAAITTLTLAATGIVAVLNHQLKEQALTDGLTGALNRRGLSVMSRYFQADIARGHSVSVALIDLDAFKEYNDAHGHLAGDVLLQEVAWQLQSGLRGGDVIARFGGDEFVILMRGVEPIDAEAILLRVAESMPAVQWSAGVAAWQHGQTFDDVLAQADGRLYAAKHRR